MSDPGEVRRTRLRIGVGAAVVVVFVGLACAILFSALAPKGQSAVVAPGDGALASESSASTATSAPSGAAIFVHILGAVANPGLYELREGDRAVDAVAAAGGFADGADQSGLNLARFVTDGEQIVVPIVGEAPVAGPGGAAGGAVVPGKVNINTADVAALETLPRVGPAMAERIIAWRDENGRFSAVEDLMSVAGIGEKTFDALKDLVTL
ncbi:ComEA family DNA-binding protein [Conyzicola sp.]|uniref:ComEA family DNA-binding protein n=1 Tax=Conyzicola sp. TaxID=1969404 RepID=UPI003989B107